MGMSDDTKDRYRPRGRSRSLSLILFRLASSNEPVPPDNVIALPKTRSLHATVCEALTNSRALLNRLENGIDAPPGGAREIVRELYVATRRQVSDQFLLQTFTKM